MAIKIGNALVMDKGTKIGECRATRGGVYQYTQEGHIVYAINVPVPVIVKGEGCIGIATPIEYTASDTTTEVLFTFSAIQDQKVAKVFYEMYRSTVTMNADSDPFDNSDMLIPGSVSPQQPKDFESDDDDDEDPFEKSFFRSMTGR
jgi:hypothetical protein